jgi:hypothetical protein
MKPPSHEWTLHESSALHVVAWIIMCVAVLGLICAVGGSTSAPHTSIIRMPPPPIPSRQVTVRRFPIAPVSGTSTFVSYLERDFGFVTPSNTSEVVVDDRALTRDIVDPVLQTQFPVLLLSPPATDTENKSVGILATSPKVWLTTPATALLVDTVVSQTGLAQPWRTASATLILLDGVWELTGV